MFDIITIGSATRDAFFEGLEFDYHEKDPHMRTGEGLCLPLGAKIPASKVTFTTGGAGTNAAVTFARQGLKSAAIVRVGNDVSGEEIKRGLERERVDVSLVQVDPLLPTSYSVILMAHHAERTILVYEGAGAGIEAHEIPWESLQTRWIYLDSLGGNLDVIKKAVEAKSAKGAKLVWNPGTKDLALGLGKLKPFLSSLDVFMANQEEVSTLFSVPYQNEKEIFQKFDELIDGIAIMTKGPKGVSAGDGKTICEAGIFPEKALVDRTGAGDAFGSGFLAGYLQGGIEEGVRVGSANGTSVLEHIGAKEGILREAEIKDVRWQKLEIRSFKI
ncbi:MAG: carbohydrate kinase family protein [Candidatus Portnoybacteria bacterium]|nr:carbohydrate kinase family protein [Candidatus Portnoybacteria bacterium]